MYDEHDSQGPEEHFPVIITGDLDEAEFYQSLLEDHDIHAIIDEAYRDALTADSDGSILGMAVLVAEENLSEAEAILKRYREEEDFEGDLADYIDDEEDEFEDLAEFDPDEEH